MSFPWVRRLPQLLGFGEASITRDKVLRRTESFEHSVTIQENLFSLYSANGIASSTLNQNQTFVAAELFSSLQ